MVRASGNAVFQTLNPQPWRLGARILKHGGICMDDRGIAAVPHKDDASKGICMYMGLGLCVCVQGS